MAIDTRAKRQNVAWIGWPGPVSVLPSGSVTQAVRQQCSWSYGGILAQVVTAGAARLRTLLGVGL